MNNPPPVATAGAANRHYWAFAAFLLAYAAAGFATIHGAHYWGDDWAQYVLHARNLVTGAPYAHTGYLFNPDAPVVGPPMYPPGLPLVLAPSVALAGTAIAALKVPGWICMVLMLPLAVRLFAPTLGTRAAMVAVALVAMHPRMWELREYIVSETPFMLFSFLALWWAQERGDEGSTRAAFVAGVVLGVLVYLALATRVTGIALLPALLVYGWARRRGLAWFAGFGLALACLLALQSALIAPPPTYSSELRAPGGAGRLYRLSQQPFGYLETLAYLFPLPLGLSVFAGLLVASASVGGAAFAISHASRPGPSGVRSHAARVPLAVWYLAAYTALLLLAPVSPNPRLLLPALPIVVATVVYCVQSLVRELLPVRAALPVLALAAAGYVLSLHATARFQPRALQATCKECLEMFAFMREHTPRDAVVVFIKPRAMALLGERHSWAPSPHYTTEAFLKRARVLGADLVVDGAPGSAFAQRYPLPEVVRARTRLPGVSVAFRNAGFVVYRLAPPKQQP